MGLRKWISRGREKPQKCEFERIRFPPGRELFVEISNRWGRKINESHDQFERSQINQVEYIQLTLDNLAAWGEELNEAVKAGRMDVFYLYRWYGTAKEFHDNWKTAREKLRKILKAKGAYHG